MPITYHWDADIHFDYKIIVSKRHCLSIFSGIFFSLHFFGADWAVGEWFVKRVWATDDKKKTEEIAMFEKMWWTKKTLPMTKYDEKENER